MASDEKGNSPGQHINREEVPFTRWWVAWAALIFLVNAVVTAILDVYVFGGWLLTGFTKWILVLVMVAGAAFGGGFVEYSRQKVKLIYQNHE